MNYTIGYSTVMDDFDENYTSTFVPLDMNSNTSSPHIDEDILSAKPKHQFPKDMLGFTAACAFIIAIFGASGNLLTIFALPMCRKLRTTSTAFVINLALVELMFCIIILPMSGAQYAYLQIHDEPLLSDFDCIFFALGRYTFTQVQLQTIVGIALTRAIAVGLPRFYQQINKTYVIVTYIVMIWLYSFFLKLPTALGLFGSYVFNRRTMECDMAFDKPSITARKVAILVEVLIPVSVVIILYIFIFIMVKLSSSRVRQASTKFKKASISAAPSSQTEESSASSEDRRRSSKATFKSLKRMMSSSSITSRFTRRSSSITHCLNTNKRDMRVARTIFIIFLMILIFSIPVGYIHFIDSEGKQPRRFLAVHIMYWLQYCLNVVVYVLLNRQYRDAYVDFVAKLLPSWERHKGFTFPWENTSITTKHPVGFNSSVKSRKETSSHDPNPTKDQRSSGGATDRLSSRQGRLSAIPEVNSNSVVSSNDEAFIEEKKYLDFSDVNDNDLNENLKILDETSLHNLDETKLSKDHPEDGTIAEKQIWLTQDGHQTSEPKDETSVRV